MRLTRIIYLMVLFSCSTQAADLRTPYERSGGNYSATWKEAIDYYFMLDQSFESLKLLTYGLTDVGRPLHLAVLSGDGDFDPQSIHRHNRRIVMVLNAIHPGEPEGVDATMMLMRDILIKKELSNQLGNVVFIAIPVYNIGGALNRSCCSRANQNGPKEYGFRGNAENLDLNRDFIKCDSRNARSFTEIFRTWQPDILIDNHTSDGADYSYTLTYISNDGALSPALSQYMIRQLTPALNHITTSQGFDMAPYVELHKDIPDSGLDGGIYPPRFSSSYAALYDCMSYTVETHMLKPFDARLKATYVFMKAVLQKTYEDRDSIQSLRIAGVSWIKNKQDFIINRTLDTLHFDMISFKGYEARHKPSALSGQDRLYYDRKSPYEKKIRFYNYSVPLNSAKKPIAYIIPQAWWKVIELLALNKVDMGRLSHDTSFNVEVYYIDGFENSRGGRPYEGHYLHQKVKLHSERQTLHFYKGDYIIYTGQEADQYLANTLEPQATDAFFAWNYFDAILQQKEYFSDYVFEDMAAELVKKDPELQQKLAAKKKEDPQFARDGYGQLDFVYRHSEWFEKSYNRYPVCRLHENLKLDLE